MIFDFHQDSELAGNCYLRVAVGLPTTEHWVAWIPLDGITARHKIILLGDQKFISWLGNAITSSNGAFDFNQLQNPNLCALSTDTDTDTNTNSHS